MTNKTIIVDDFHDNFEFVRRKAINSKYTRVDNQLKQVVFSYATLKVMDRLKSVQKIKKLDYSLTRLNCNRAYFALSTKDDEIKSKKMGAWVHTDQCKYVGLIYLNTENQCTGGTAFFKHKRHSISTSFDLENSLNDSGSLKADIEKDSSDISKWEVLSEVVMVPNRLVLFDPKQYHQATSFFGKDVNDARLVQTLIFN